MNLLPTPASWFVVTLSTLAAGSISALALASQQPAAIILGSGLGAFGASAITQSRKQTSGQSLASSDQLKQMQAEVEKTYQARQAQVQQHLQQELTQGLASIDQKLTQAITTQQAHLNQLQAEQATEIKQLQAYLTTQAEAAKTEFTIRPNQDSQIQITPTPALESVVKPQRTAILYDIENLTRGYHSRIHQIRKVSIASIFEQIRGLEVVGEIMVQRAYADWSHHGLTSIRSEISYLGIKPIQFVNFGHEKKTNATDIQLAVDAIEMIYRNPLVETVVLVSGDGGFTSLASKLREYGKTVIGCSYSNAASRNLQAICHYFVHIPDPTENASSLSSPSVAPPILRSERNGHTLNGEASDLEATPDIIGPISPGINGTTQVEPLKTVNPAILRWSGLKEACFLAIKPIQSEQPEAIVNKIREVLNVCFHLSSHAAKFQAMGFNPSLIEPLLDDLIPNLKFVFEGLGLIRYSEYLRYVCTDSPYCLGRNQDGIKVCLRNALPEHLTLEADLILDT